MCRAVVWFVGSLIVLDTVCWLTVGQPAPAAEQTPPEQPQRVVSMGFGWPFLPPEKTAPRGGSTQGSDVALDPAPSPAWRALQEAGLSKVEQDRRAILALAGSYRVSFQFVETMGLADGYEPPRPYFSWGTEHVHVLESETDFISLQHTLVMFFVEADGSTSGPLVTKHWRQDWTYEDRDTHVYRGNRVWERVQLDAERARGGWTQAVFQVDDSPRYEAVGRWEHAGGLSRWTSSDAWRPLPRREFSVRDDYNVLAGVHVISITPTGWLHEQHNRKLMTANSSTDPACIGCETGLDSYERISDPKVATAADAYFAKTGGYWAAVRESWRNVLREHDRFELRGRVDGALLFEEHFGFAAALEEGRAFDPVEARSHALSTIEKFLVR